MKKAFCILLILCLSLTFVPLSVFAVDETAPDPAAYPDFADKNYGSLYAHATLGGSSKETWQRWHKDQQGVNFEDGLRYFFLPASADDKQVEVYNNYDDAVTIGEVVIEPYTSAFIDYKEGEPVTVNRGSGINAKEYNFVVLKSDAEASVYVNDIKNSYKDFEGEIQQTDLWSFLVQNKENSVADSSCSIVDENGTLDTTLKKIKGRGNTNWRDTNKKPFNLTFYDKTNIGGVVDKKFSFVSNAKDSTLIRNAIMYDLAYNVGNPYASDQSFVDFYVNGVYRGAYIACQKIDLGKNSVVSLKDESDDKDTDFNFLVEVDVWNYKSDVYFVSDKGYHVVLKTPDLDDYDETNPSMKAKYDYISSTYQKLEDALYSGTLADIEEICDLESLATQYLLQEFGKNCDGGYTSTFFTYNAAEGKFYAAPLWDCDSDLGAVDCIREGCSTSTIDHTGWTTRLAKYEDTINPLGQAFYVKGISSDGKTFEEICKKIWQDKFLPMIDVMLGNNTAEGRLKSIDEYANSTKKYAYNNYVMWDFMWLCAGKNSSLKTKYSKDLEGEIMYLKDWTKERALWISSMYDAETPEPPKPDRTIYFSTNLDWDNVHFYSWSTGFVPTKWPGEKAAIVNTLQDGSKLYKAELPEGVTSVVFNNGSNGEQTVDITLTAGKNYYITTENTGETNKADEYIYNVEASTYSEPITETTETTFNTEIQETESTITESIEVTTTEKTEQTTSTTNTEGSTATDPVETQNTTATATDATENTTLTETPTQSASVTITETNKTTATTPPSTTIEEELTFGDVNLDNKVNIKDATTLQKHLAKIQQLPEKNLSVSDTDKNGRITISDATTIQKKIAGLINWD